MQVQKTAALKKKKRKKKRKVAKLDLYFSRLLSDSVRGCVRRYEGLSVRNVKFG